TRTTQNRKSAADNPFAQPIGNIHIELSTSFYVCRKAFFACPRTILRSKSYELYRTWGCRK
ncbi:hypothetical protein MOF32_26930, partial [Priestia megaterium]|uniref:hypothetical protein n=1 Tax=Priestia megaterium TaxID=1404 RepID=UPI00227DB48A